MKTLFLASKSESRQNLLRESKINFKLVDQNFDESLCDRNLPLRKLVESIAQKKMEHVILPDANEQDSCLVLTADTMGIDREGKIHGKPKDKEDAIRMIKSFQNGSLTGTAICLEQRNWVSGQWEYQKRIVRYAQAEYLFFIPDKYIEWYLDNFENEGYLNVSGAVQIEGIGAQFLKNLNGSYSAVLGLPLYELRGALEEF